MAYCRQLRRERTMYVIRTITYCLLAAAILASIVLLRIARADLRRRLDEMPQELSGVVARFWEMHSIAASQEKYDKYITLFYWVDTLLLVTAMLVSIPIAHA